MKKVSRMVIAPRTSLGRFFMKRDSKEMISMVEATRSMEEHVKAMLLVGSSTYLNPKQIKDLSKKPGAMSSTGFTLSEKRPMSRMVARTGAIETRVMREKTISTSPELSI